MSHADPTPRSTDRAFLFSHSLVRDAAFALLSKRECERLSKLALDVLSQADESTAMGAALLPHLNGAEPAKAAALLRRAAAAEATRENPVGALALYDRLAHLKAAPWPDRFEGMNQSTRLLERLGRTEDALANAGKTLQQADSNGDGGSRGRARLRYGGFLRRRAKHKQALEMLLQAESFCRAAKDSDGQAESVCERGMVHDATGEHERAEECYVAGERLFRRAGNLEGVCRTLGNLAAVHLARGQGQSALAMLAEAGDLAEILGKALICARIAGNRATVLYNMGEFEKAVQANNEALVGFQACGDVRGVATTHANLGGVLEQAGEFKGAEAEYASAGQYALELGDPRLAARLLGNRGVLCAARGDTKVARQLYAQALAQAQAVQDRDHEALLLANIGRSWQSDGKPAKALESFEAALQIARSQNLHGEVAALLALKAQSLLESNDASAAQVAALDTLDWCDQHRISGCLAQFEALVVLAHYEQGQGNLSEAKMLAREAQDLAPQLGPQSKADSLEISATLRKLAALGEGSLRKRTRPVAG